LGAIVGHELVHGFDNNGRLYDGEGVLRQWWTNESIARFDNRSQCIVDEYSAMFIRQNNSGGFIDGELTLGENIADVGGVHMSYLAYRTWLATQSHLDQMASDRLFFKSFAELWCIQESPQFLQTSLLDVHSPFPARVNGPLQMFPQFAQAYSCPAGSAMNPEEKCFLY